MLVTDVLALLCLMLFCACAAGTDLKRGMISNHLTMSAFCVGLIYDVIFCFQAEAAGRLLFLKNSSVLIVAAILLYATHILAGGDVKLLMATALLFPPSFYWNDGQTEITLWYLLGTSFLCGYLYLLVESVIQTLQSRESVSKSTIILSLKSSLILYGHSLAYLALFSHLYYLFVAPYCIISPTLYTIICIAYLWGLASSGILRLKRMVLAVLVFDVIMSFLTGRVTVSTYWPSYLIALFCMFLRSFMNQFGYSVIQTKHVERGMILSLSSSLQMQRSRVKGLPAASDESLKSRLTQEEAESVRRWGKSKLGSKRVTVVRKMPFAVFILCGLILYLVIGGVIR